MQARRTHAPKTGQTDAFLRIVNFGKMGIDFGAEDLLRTLRAFNLLVIGISRLVDLHVKLVVSDKDEGRKAEWAFQIFPTDCL